jgi:predicted helicase
LKTGKLDTAEVFAQYLLRLRKFAAKDKTEHSDRAALEELLNAFAADAQGKPKVQHEPKRATGKGAPDFKITQTGMILGYVENKAIGENLTKVLKSEQIAKYKTLSPNIILTDYLEFAWISKDGVQRETLCHETDLENRKFNLNPERIEAVARLLAGFFSTAPEGIRTSKPLAEALAARSKLLRDYLGEELVRQDREHQEGRLFGLYKTFRDQVFHELTLKEFADAFAQMLAYGLFLARLNTDANTKITLSNARDHIPGSFQLIHELVEFLIELNKPEYAEVRWVVEEVVSIVNGLDLASIHEDLSFRQRRAISRKVRASDEEEHRLFERDPFIYFYEDYLKAYDKETRKGRGVYYTPPPVVNFIVRAINDILKDNFGIKEGLADNNRVTVLDFACGTGTFLLEVFQQIFENIGGADKAIAKKVVSDHILKNIYGFEYLIAPYTIAHLKLSQYLRDKGHPLKTGERLQVLLTNTLEPIHPEPNFLLPAITQEAEAAQKVKDKPILVITGNPPYFSRSKNKGAWATSAIEAYKKIDGKPLGEKKTWLQDDYVKFIRFAQTKMDAVDEGIVGIITNHSYLDNPTFRGMRASLLKTFDQIWLIDLHGNTKKKERSPDGGEDKNVFDIEQGVAIALFIKRPTIKEKGVWHTNWWGSRISKYQRAADLDLRLTGFQHFIPARPFYFFQPRSENKVYDSFISVTDIFQSNVAGIITARDSFAISLSRQEQQRRVARFSDLRISDDVIRNEFELKDTRGWSLHEARRSLAESDWEADLRKLLYRPFDDRWTAYREDVIDWGRWESFKDMLGDNLALIVSRQSGAIGEAEMDAVSVSDTLVEFNFFRRGGEAVFPLFLYDAERKSRREAFTADFRNFVDEKYSNHWSPEEVFGYIYSVLHAHTYRTDYAEPLRSNFPRIPFPDMGSDFESLSELGWELVQAHLLKEYPDAGLAKFDGKGDETVEAVRYSVVEKAVWINKTQCFKPVPEDVWDFHIGGYQVLEKYLKSRKGRQLSLDEIKHVGATADSLAFTIAQQAKIDKAYKKAFPDSG